MSWKIRTDIEPNTKTPEIAIKTPFVKSIYYNSNEIFNSLLPPDQRYDSENSC